MAETTDAGVAQRGRPNAHPFARSFAVAVVLTVVGVAAMFLLLGPPESAYGMGAAMGRILGPALIAALITGFVARSSQSTWSWGRYAVMVVGITIGFTVLTTLGAIGNSTG